jgi:uncharacterized protein YdaU (DUF1376 family)
MTQNQKYTVHVFQDGDTWTAQILRQVTSRKRSVSKQQTGFTQQAEADEWAHSELQKYISAQQARNVKHATQRTEAQQRERARAERRRAQAEARNAARTDDDA